MSRRILYLINTLTHGGAEHQLLETIRLLERRRYEPHVAVLNSPPGEAYEALEIPKFQLDFRSFRHPSTLRVSRRLIRYIRHHRIDLVQAYFQDPFLLAALTKPLHGARLVGSFRDMGFWRTRGQTLKMRLSYPFYDAYLANSEAVKAHYVDVDGLDPARVGVIYNGLDVDQLGIGGDTGTLPDPPVVGIVANLNRSVKRVQDFISAAAIVHRQLPQVRFCVVGGGHLQSGLATQARELGLGDNIRFTGLLSHPVEEVKGWYLGAITSETEGFCNAILEYMACGLPVVATATGGNLELIEDGVHGLLAPVAEPITLADRMLELLKDRSRAQAMGADNARRIRRDFTWERQIALYQDYLDGVLDAP